MIRDIFALLESNKKYPESEIISFWGNGFKENPEKALKLLFYSRDIKNGLGKRYNFQIIINHLAKTNPEIIKANMKHIPLFGRWDDLFVLLDTKVHNEVITFLREELAQEHSLLFKWMPREASSKSKLAKKLIKELGFQPKAYRKLLSQKSKVVENKMCQNRWKDIDYNNVPFLAQEKYKNAYKKHDSVGWEQFVGSKINSFVYTVNNKKESIDSILSSDRYAILTLK